MSWFDTYTLSVIGISFWGCCIFGEKVRWLGILGWFSAVIWVLHYIIKA